MLADMTYSEAVAKAGALKHLGMTDIHLYRGTDYPWHLVSEVGPGGTHRLDMATSIRFKAIDPTHGLTFSWYLDIEDRSANGHGYYQIAADECRAAMTKLSVVGREKFAAYLLDCAAKVRAQGDKYRDIMNRQYRDARALQELADEAV